MKEEKPWCKKIESMEELKTLSTNENLECFIHLNGGMRSSKTITYFPQMDTFDVYNDIDGSYEEGLDEQQLAQDTNIVDALEKGSLYQYLN